MGAGGECVGLDRGAAVGAQRLQGTRERKGSEFVLAPAVVEDPVRGRFGLVEPTEPEVGEAEVGPRSVTIGPQPQRFFAVGDRLREQPLLPVSGGQGVLRARRRVAVDAFQSRGGGDRALWGLALAAEDRLQVARQAGAEPLGRHRIVAAQCDQHLL